MAYREFVGNKWVKYFNGIKVKASHLFSQLIVGEKTWKEKSLVVCEVKCYLTACKVNGRNNKPELQLIISYDQETCSIKEYENRWQIETMFRGMKSSGLNLEHTHLKHIQSMWHGCLPWL
ncbi:hypothetical protein [Salibacter halophilus]|uniref:hypothetical protein n=1 Tax=Salibacter halophilus TaxID=1803916 RepID=UPI0012492734|nr:hypothetical protein [Salibacter halophilus]